MCITGDSKLKIGQLKDHLSTLLDFPEPFLHIKVYTSQPTTPHAQHTHTHTHTHSVWDPACFGSAGLQRDIPVSSDRALSLARSPFVSEMPLKLVSRNQELVPGHLCHLVLVSSLSIRFRPFIWTLPAAGVLIR